MSFAVKYKEQAEMEQERNHAQSERTPVPVEPPKPQKQVSLDEQALREGVTLSSSMVAEWPYFLGAAALTVIISMIAYSFPGSVLRFHLGFLFGGEVGLSVPVAMIVPIGVVIWAIHDSLNTRYEIGWRWLVTESGVLWAKKSRLEIDYQKIYSLQVEQTLMQRLFGIGHVKVAVIGPGDGVMILKDLKNPQQVKSMIARRVAATAEVS